MKAMYTFVFVLGLALLSPGPGVTSEAATPLTAVSRSDISHLELSGLAAVVSDGDELRLFDPRGGQLVAITTESEELRRSKLEGPNQLIAVDGKFVQLSYARPDGRFWVPSTLTWRASLDFDNIGEVDLFASREVKSADSLAYGIGSILNFTVTSDQMVGIGSLVATGATQDLLAFFSLRAKPDGRASPVTVQMPIADRDATVLYRIYNYMTSTSGWAYFVSLEVGKEPELYRWHPGLLSPEPMVVEGATTPFGITPFIDPMSMPHGLLEAAEREPSLITGLLSSANGHVFALVREHAGEQVGRWLLVRLTPARDGSASFEETATFELPTRAPQISLSVGNDGYWYLFELAPLTDDIRQPVQTLIKLPAGVIEGGRRDIKPATDR